MKLQHILAAGVLAGGVATAKQFRYAEDQAPAIVNPLFTTTMSEARLNELLFEGLFTDDSELNTTPALAERFEVSDDGLSMELSVRRSIRFHDGHPLTAEDVVFTIEAMKSDETLSTESGRVEWIERAELLDTHRVRLHFKEPQARPQDRLFFKILPAHRFRSTTVKRTDPFRANPIGTGPFMLERYNGDGSISLKRNESYRVEASIDEVSMREVSDKKYQVGLLIYESLEALVRVLPRDIAVLEADRGVELYPYQTNSWWYLGFNLNRPPLDDARVRSGIAQLIDIPSLLAPVGTGDLLSGPFVPSSPYYNHDVPRWEQDESAGAAALESAGFARTERGWERDGQPLSLTIRAHRTVDSSQEVVIALQSQLKAAGIQASIDFLDEAAWKSAVWRERDFDAIVSQWSFDRNEDVREQLHSRGGRNFTGYRSEAADALLEIARTSRDPQEKKQALRDLHRTVRDDVPMVFLWTLDSYSAMRVSVRDVVIHPFYYFTWAADWRIQ
jgi:peptide/nickel transport system substrate-binding protein